MRKVISMGAIAILIIIALSCSKDDKIAYDPAPGLESVSDEAQLAAIWLSDEIQAPIVLAKNIQADLEYLRAHFTDSIPEINTPFVYPAVPRQVILGLNEEAIEKVRNGTYGAWNPLNDQFEVIEIDTSKMGKYGRVRLVFQNLLNVYQLADLYAEVRGVLWAITNGLGGDYSNIYPWYVDGQVAYLLRYGWGDCPAGCINSHFWYFKRVGDLLELHGDFEYDYHSPPPDWWDEIKDAYSKYRLGRPN